MKRKQNSRRFFALCTALACSLSVMPAAPVLAQEQTAERMADQSAERKNLAKNATFSGTNNDPTYCGFSCLNDGNKSNYWDGGVAPGYFIADLGRVCLVDEIVAVPLHFSDGRYYHYEIAISSNGLDFETVAVHEDDEPGPDTGDVYTFEQPLSARYVRVRMTYDSKNPSVHMSEIEIYGTETDDPGSAMKANLAVGKPVTGSGQNIGTITDGKIDAFQFWDGGVAPNHFTIDLQNVCDISRMVAFPYWREGGYYHYEIYSSIDGVEYTRVAQKQTDDEETSEGDAFNFDQDIKARYIRVLMTKNSRNPSVHMNEFQVFGTVDEDYEEPDPITYDDPDNVAKGKPTRCAELSGNDGNITDGDLTTSWTTKYTPAYVDIDLLEEHTLSEMFLHFNASTYKDLDGNLLHQEICKYSIYGSNDYENFDLLASKKDETPAGSIPDQISLNNQSYRFLRIYLEGHKGVNLGLSEVRVHGTPTGENTGDKRTGSIDEVMEIKPFNETEYAAPIKQAETIENVYGIVERTVGNEYRDWFDFELGEKQANGNDWFELSMKDGKVHITGNNGISLATGLNYYYKYYAHVNISEQARQTVMPSSIVPVEGTIHKETEIAVRYAFNYCTLDHTFAFFGEDDWQRENDWLALNGVNVVLDLAGQEAVWIKYLQSLGYSVDEAKDWLAGPGYYAWQFMANMENYGGPVSDDWVAQRLDMARKTQRWKRSLGMQTVMQGYAGMVPNNLKEKQKDVAILEQGKWCGLDRPDMIRTDGETYDTFADQFYSAQKWALGDTSDYFAVDPFHEGGIRPSDLSDDIISREVLSSMLKNNENAVWLVQGWLNNPTKALLEGMGENREDHVMVLDLTAHTGGTHGSLTYGSTTLSSAEYEGTPWIWCALTNYGGNYSLSGDLANVASRMYTERQKSEKMKGVGIISEGSHDSPVVYDLLFEAVWEDEQIDVDQWLAEYIKRRYGSDNENVKKAWDLLHETYFNSWGVASSAFMPVWNNEYKLYNEDPTMMKSFGLPYNYLKTVKALEQFARAYDELKDCETYRFDLSEMMRQVCADASVQEYNLMLEAINSQDIEGFRQSKERFLALFDLEDEVQATNKDQMVGEWIGKAADWSQNMDDFSKNVLKLNAKALLTVWHSSDTSLIDYTHRYYSGLLKDVYKPRWSSYLDYVENWMNGTADSYTDDAFNLYWDWTVDDTEYSRTPTTDDASVKSLISRVLSEGKRLTAEEELDNICLNKPVETSSSQEPEGNGLKASNATDGNLSSLWSGGPYEDKPWLIVDLQEEYDLDAIRVVCTWNYQSRYYHYKVYTSTDKENWELVGQKDNSVLETQRGTRFAQDKKRARYIKVEGIYNSHNESFHINEILAYGSVHADKTQLRALRTSIEEENLQENAYSRTTWAALQEAITKADEILAQQSVEQEDVDAAYTKLDQARNGLIEAFTITFVNGDGSRTPIRFDKGSTAEAVAGQAPLATKKDGYRFKEWTPKFADVSADAEYTAVYVTDKQELSDTIILIREAGLVETDYTPTSWSTLQTALQNADDVMKSSTADPQAVSNALAALNAAYKGLKEKAVLHYDLLDLAIHKVQSLSEEQYAQTKWADLLKAVEAAKSIRENAQDQDAIDTAAADLNKALLSMRKTPKADLLKALSESANE